MRQILLQREAVPLLRQIKDCFSLIQRERTLVNKNKYGHKHRKQQNLDDGSYRQQQGDGTSAPQAQQELMELWGLTSTTTNG